MDKISHLTSSNENNWSRYYESQELLKQKDIEISNLKSQLSILQKENEELLFKKKSEGTMLFELEHLKQDNRQLLQMLKTTKEYKDFASLADDNLQSISFLQKLGQERENKGRICAVEEARRGKEEDMWVPAEAFQFAREFRFKYGGELTDELIEYLLFEVSFYLFFR
jgi:hypothetical protein